MRRWTFALGGLIIWAVHFAGTYAIASLTALGVGEIQARLMAIALSVACLIAASMIFASATRRLRHRESEDSNVFMHQLAAFGAGGALLAIVWQTLPFLIG